MGENILRELDNAVIEAASDGQKMNDLIAAHRNFILKCTSKAVHHYVTESDDEWSIALFAFSEAVKSYDLGKGSFTSFADMVIRRRLADYYKSQKKYNSEVPVSPHIFDTEPEEEDEDLMLRLSVAEKVAVSEDRSLADEIEAANQAFAKYGFSFYDLTECSPKAAKTKGACASAVTYILQTPLLAEEMESTCQLPIKKIEINRKIPRKIIERHRKYIIAAVVILNGEYPFLADYLQTIRKELNNV